MRGARMQTPDGNIEETAVAGHTERARHRAEVPSQAQAVTYCKGTVRSGRFAGFRCGNASPCMEHDIMPVAYNLQALGPDEYPLGFYVEMAKQKLTPRETTTPRKTYKRWSVLR
jgi:hypothetical protein